MTVYELIQELSKYNADTEVRFRVNAEFNTDVEAEFDDNVDFDDIYDHERDRYRPYIEINLEYQEVIQ